MTPPPSWPAHLLAPHWQLGELLVSRDHPGLVPRTPPPWRVAANLGRLAGVLEQVRMRFGLTVCSSGWRPEPLNAAVGGEATSQHLTGCAADIHVPWLEDHAGLFQFLEALDHAFSGGHGHEARLLSQAILYVDGLGRGTRVHLAIHDPQQPTAGVGREWMLARRVRTGWGYEVLDRRDVADADWTP